MSRSRMNYNPRAVDRSIDDASAYPGARNRRPVPPLLPPTTRAPLLPTPPRFQKVEKDINSLVDSFTRTRFNEQVSERGETRANLSFLSSQ